MFTYSVWVITSMQPENYVDSRWLAGCIIIIIIIIGVIIIIIIIIIIGVSIIITTTITITLSWPPSVSSSLSSSSSSTSLPSCHQTLMWTGDTGKRHKQFSIYVLVKVLLGTRPSGWKIRAKYTSWMIHSCWINWLSLSLWVDILYSFVNIWNICVCVVSVELVPHGRKLDVKRPRVYSTSS